MKITTDNKDVILSDTSCFDLTHIFECGQCFRWNKTTDNEYLGIAFGKVLKISKENNGFRFKNTTVEEFNSVWKNYFDLDFDYLAVQKTLSCDAVLKETIKSGFGIRILRQELFETIISFIISQNNNIPRIKLIIERFCQEFGNKISLPDGIFYSFPSAESLAGVTLSDLAFLKAGFRDKYILDAINKINSGTINLSKLKTMDFDTAEQTLLEIKGVGKKVANCILLFSLHMVNAFPVDVWVKRVMSNYYFGGKEPGCDLYEFAKKKFSPYGGFAQQYLFYHARENKLK